MPSPIRVLVVDDHPLVRDAMVLHLRATPQVQVVGEVADLGSARRSLEQVDVDVVIADLHLPDGTGTELAGNDSRLLVLTGDDRPGTAAAVRASGADGLLHKSHATGPTLLSVLRRLMAGEEVFPVPSPDAAGLTRRERDVLRAIAAGNKTSEVADQLGLKPDTVRTYVDRIFRKLEVHSRAEAVARATELGELAG